MHWSRSRFMSLQCHHALCSQRLQVWFKVETNLSLDSTMKWIWMSHHVIRNNVPPHLNWADTSQSPTQRRTACLGSGSVMCLPKWAVGKSIATEPETKETQLSHFNQWAHRARTRDTACSIPTELKCHKLCVPRSGSEVSQKSEANPQVYPKPMTPSLSHWLKCDWAPE